MSFTTRPELLGSFGMVASTHWLASAVAMSVLERDGNAFDAAVAGAFTLNVVEPHLNGLGGDAPIIGVEADGDEWVLCGQGVSPAAADPAAFTALGLEAVPGTGHLPAVVPGAFGAWLVLLLQKGTVRLRTVLEPAISYARDGYPLVPLAVTTIRTVETLFRTHWPTSARCYLPGGEVPAPRSRFRNPELAALLQRILEHAESVGADRDRQIEAALDYFYRGPVAEAVDAFQRVPVMDASGEAHAGLLRYEDLANWRPSWEAPLSVEFAGHRVLKPGPWSQGPVLLQQLQLLEALGAAEAEPGSAALIHLVVESAKLAFADRDAFYGDPERAEVPIAALLDPGYAAERARLVDPARASAALRPGAPLGRTGTLPALPAPDAASADGLGEPTVRLSFADAAERTAPDGVVRGDTCHIDVADRFGNVVSATPSGGWLQSSPVVPGLGFTLPTRGQMFWLEPGLPNSIAPGRRPRTTLSPSILLSGDRRTAIAFGTPGGDQQDQWTVSFLLNHLRFGMDLQQAIDAPNWHTDHLISSFAPRRFAERVVHLESRLPEATVEGLRALGHEVRVEGPWSLGRISAAGRRDDGLLLAAANPRGMQGYAAGR